LHTLAITFPLDLVSSVVAGAASIFWLQAPFYSKQSECFFLSSYDLILFGHVNIFAYFFKTLKQYTCVIGSKEVFYVLSVCKHACAWCKFVVFLCQHVAHIDDENPAYNGLTQFFMLQSKFKKISDPLSLFYQLFHVIYCL